jgi:hypothetical protein
MNDRSMDGGTTRHMARHALIQAVLILLLFLPGGLVWNRVDPWVLGWPFSTFVTAVLLPLLIFANVVAYVRGCWRADAALMAQLQAGRNVVEAEQAAAPVEGETPTARM